MNKFSDATDDTTDDTNDDTTGEENVFNPPPLKVDIHEVQDEFSSELIRPYHDDQ